MLAFVLMIFYFFIILVLFLMADANVITVVFAKIGIPPEYIFTAFSLILVGSFINIPMKNSPRKQWLTKER